MSLGYDILQELISLGGAKGAGRPKKSSDPVMAESLRRIPKMRGRPVKMPIGSKFGAFEVVGEGRIIGSERHWEIRCRCSRSQFWEPKDFTRGWQPKCLCSPNRPIVYDNKRFNDTINQYVKMRFPEEFFTPLQKGQAAIRKINRTKSAIQTAVEKAQRRATINSMAFDIDVNFAQSMIEQQKFKCALSGIEISLAYSQEGHVTASIDRIDSRGGYERSNVQWVHKTINMMKRAMLDEDFVRLCRSVSDHSGVRFLGS